MRWALQDPRYRGINHLALVCRYMARTVDFYQGVLGMAPVKTIELPGSADFLARTNR